MKNLFKTPKGMMRIIKQNAMAVVAIGIAMGSYGLMSFGTNTSVEETIHFKYNPPTTDPYSQANVENLTNWTEAEAPCATSEDEAACSIDVPRSHTLNGDGIELDPTKVELNTSETDDTGIFKVETPATQGKGYSNPVNKSML